MKFYYLPFTLGCLALLVFTGPTRAGSASITDAYPSAPVNAEQSAGFDVYRKTCTYCHDHEGIAPKIRGRNVPALLTKVLVRTGKGAMPAFRPTEISNAELDVLANWLAKDS